MEFGILIHGYAPRDPHNNALEHDWVRRETELVREADRCGFKYVWLTEHHFLEEYSHLSASEVFIPYLGALTERLHLGLEPGPRAASRRASCRRHARLPERPPRPECPRRTPHGARRRD